MAVIRKIRSYSGLLIAVIGFALAAFVLGDFLGYGPIGTQRTHIGKVESNQISYVEFEQRVTENIDNWKAQTGTQNIGQRETFQIRQEVWNQMLRELLLDEELDRLGIHVSTHELSDMIHGADPHQWIVSSFRDPQTGEYDPQQVINFLQNFDELDPNMRNQWLMLEQHIKRERQENKYYNLIRQGYYVPQVLAQNDFRDRNKTADIRFIFMPYAQIADTLVQVSDRELKAVYDKNKHLYKQEASRSLEYVAFPVFPTEEDRQALRREIEELKAELETSENIPGFINAVSDTRFDPTFLSREEVSPEVEQVLFDAEPGTIHGPYLEDNRFVIAMLNDAQMRPDSMHASHILISYTGARGAAPDLSRNPARAMELADSILEVVRRSPARFETLAGELSDDPSAAMNQGDLEWFRDGDMVPEFNEAVIQGSVGSFVRVETQFGFHVIQIKGKAPATRKVQIAKLSRDIEPSSRTFQMVFGNASEFANSLREKGNFEEVTSEQGLSKRVVESVGPMDSSIPGIDNPREIIRWAFNENTNEGDFSPIFDIDGRFIVASLTKKSEEGIPALDDIREEIMAIAIRDKKFEQIASQMNQALGQGNMEAAARELQTDVREANDITFNMRNLPGAGAEPKVVGTALSLGENTVSDPIKGNTGVFVVEVVRIEQAGQADDLEQVKSQMKSTFINRVQNEVFRALRNNASIEDNRSEFY